MVMHHMLIILTLTFMQGHTDLNHEHKNSSSMNTPTSRKQVQEIDIYINHLGHQPTHQPTHQPINQARTQAPTPLTFCADLFLGEDGELSFVFLDVRGLGVLVLAETHQLALLPEPQLLQLPNLLPLHVQRLEQRVDLDLQWA